jgi:hypothetical protein
MLCACCTAVTGAPYSCGRGNVERGGRVKTRKITGSALTEFGPALFVIISLFFPLIDMLALGFEYGFAAYFNFREVRELSLARASEGGAEPPKAFGDVSVSKDGGKIHQQLVQEMEGTGLLQILLHGASSDRIKTTVYYRAPHSNEGSAAQALAQPTVTAVGNFTFPPLIRIPALAFIPGLGADTTIEISQTATREEYR